MILVFWNIQPCKPRIILYHKVEGEHDKMESRMFMKFYELKYKKCLLICAVFGIFFHFGKYAGVKYWTKINSAVYLYSYYKVKHDYLNHLYC